MRIREGVSWKGPEKEILLWLYVYDHPFCSSLVCYPEQGHGTQSEYADTLLLKFFEQLITDAARIRSKGKNTKESANQRNKTEPKLHLFGISPPFLRVEQTLHVSYLLTLRDLSAKHAFIVGLGIHQRQSSRRSDFDFRIIVFGVQAVCSCDPDPTISHDG